MQKYVRTAGDRNGRLTLIRELERNPNDPVKSRVRQRLFLFKCDCGTEVTALWKPKSCGCLQREKAAETGRGKRKSAAVRGADYLYVNYVNRATRRGIEFRLTRDDFVRLTSLPCFYCGCPPSSVMLQQKKRKDYSYTYNGIDRAENTKGYTLENAVPCCGACNIAKHMQPQTDFFKWVSRIHANLVTKGLVQPSPSSGSKSLP